MNQELENYIKESKNSGFTDEQIKQELKKAGWQENDINQAFDYSVPVPPVNVSKPEKKSFVYYYIEGFKKYADFNGRSRRKEYWFFVLGNLIVGIFIFGIGLIIVGGNRGSLALSIFFSAFSLLIIIP
ncbi:DUF805 domain-containing protein, partial [Patescibacteria group bacterium]|nr:DUF805 domain-containing protein [Patescibacteria group bacterium]